MVKSIGLIDNLSDIQNFVENKFYSCTAHELLTATGGNTGNVAFVHGTQKILGNPIRRIGWGSDPQVVRASVSHIVVCCANQVGAHVDLGGWADRLEKFGLPVVLVGLGAQSDNYDVEPIVPDGTKRFLKVVGQLRVDPLKTNISVRGDFTRRVLESLGVDAVSTGCPSLMISSRIGLGQEILKRQQSASLGKIAVAAGNPWHAPSCFLEPTLMDIVNYWSGAYVLQHPELVFQLVMGERDLIAPAKLKRMIDVAGGKYSAESLTTWLRKNAYYFADVSSWMRFYDHFDLVLGPRYHGVALGIQIGVPGCVYTIDSRTRELCEGTGIKSIPISSLKGMSPLDVVKASRWTDVDADVFDKTRKEKAGIFVDFIQGNCLEPSVHLRDLTKSL